MYMLIHTFTIEKESNLTIKSEYEIVKWLQQ